MVFFKEYTTLRACFDLHIAKNDHSLLRGILHSLGLDELNQRLILNLG